MASATSVITVACNVLPDGTIVYCDHNKTSINTVWDQWRKSLTEDQKKAHEDENTQGGVIIMRMLPGDYFPLQKRFNLSAP